jgi:hypothetical protein
VNCLQADELQTDMAAARDLMLTYVKDRMGWRIHMISSCTQYYVHAIIK